MSYNKKSVYQNGALRPVGSMSVGQSCRLYWAGNVSKVMYYLKEKRGVKCILLDDRTGRIVKVVNSSYLVLPV